MTLVNNGCVCGLCEASGQNVHQTPGTFPRILQALDLNKLPPLLTEEELRQRIGLCNRCENKIKLLEEATNIRDNLKESFVSNLKNMTGNYDSLRSKADTVSQSFTNAFQQYNEITPDQHSTKRKISSFNTSSDFPSTRRKQLKTQITHTAAPISPAASAADSVNSSDEENVQTVNQFSPASPQSSTGSYTPPANKTKTNSNQVLSELTAGRNRRKQARPSKVAADGTPSSTATTVSDVQPDPSSSPHTPISNRLTQSSLSKREQSHSPSLEPKQNSRSTPTPSSSTSCSTATPPHTSLPFNTNLYQSILSRQKLASPASTAQTNSALLFAQSLYNAAAASKTSLLAINNPIIFGNQLSGAASTTLPFNKTMLPTISSSSLLTPTSSILMSVKREPNAPIFNYGIPTSTTPVTTKASSTTAVDSTDSKSLAAEAHTLVKTEKRRYCKVCAASSRKANNGRPPQSRFLCLLCNMPMCRSCIEEHRFRVMVKAEEDSDSKSASARLLQAVKMKDKASTPKSTNTSTKSPSTSTPPSNSSLIYGSLSSGKQPSDVTQRQQQILNSMLPTMSVLASSSPIGLPNLASPDNKSSSLTRNSDSGSFKPIAPAPPKLSKMPHDQLPGTKSPNTITSTGENENLEEIDPISSSQDSLSKSETTTPALPKLAKVSSNKNVKINIFIRSPTKTKDDVIDNAVDDEEDEEGKLVISECDLNESGCARSPDIPTDHTEITDKIANETAAMLDQNIVDDYEDGSDSSRDSATAFQSNENNKMCLPKVLEQQEKDSLTVSTSASNIPMQQPLAV